MSSSIESRLERLERLLEEERKLRQQAEIQAEDAQRRAEDERRRAEDERDRAEDARYRAEDAQRRVEAANERLQSTTFGEFLRACHENFHNAFAVETDKRFRTKGSMTNVKDKYFPKSLREWEDYPEMHLQLFDQVYGFFHPPDQQPPRLFNSITFCEELGRDLGLRKIASEADLQSYERTALETMVTRVINQLCEIETAQAQFNLEQGISFENHVNALSDVAEEVQQYLNIRTPRASPEPVSSSESETEKKRKKTRADQFCVYRNVEDVRKLLFLVEYKPPHKISKDNLQAGFRPMDIEETLRMATIPTELEAKLQYNADQLIAAVATQTFHYMIENGLEYSYITTGETFVFLRIKEDDPTTLYYHLAVPGDEIDDQELDFLLSQTAISQVISLCLMAFGSEQRDQRWIRNAMSKLEKYQVDYEAILHQIPPTERKLAPSSAYKGRKNPNPKKSPYFTRQRANKDKGKTPADTQTRTKTKTSCGSEEEMSKDDDHEDPDTPSKQAMSRIAGSRSKSTSKDTGAKNESSRNTISDSKGKQRQYCTQLCLLGLARGLPLDQTCPNILSHRIHGDQHAISLQQFGELLQRQLEEDLDHDCEPLGLQGARGALFKLTLASHGYVFVGKGTVKAFVSCLQHEGRVYGHLEKVQGTAVPVYLGSIDLIHCYYLDLGVRILHFLLMSYGGSEIEQGCHIEEARQTMKEVRNEGVEQEDFRYPNCLWNEENQRVMLIDFERATYIDCSKSSSITSPKRKKEKTVLQEISHNPKRKRAVSRKIILKASAATKKSVSKAQPRQRNRV